MFGVGRAEELIIVLVIILVLFGAKKLPELAKGISESVREVRKGFHDEPRSASSAESKANDKA